MKTDRDIFWRIVVTMESGRDIIIDELLRKELCAIPLSLATTDYALRSTNKAELVRILEVGAKETRLSTVHLI